MSMLEHVWARILRMVRMDNTVYVEIEDDERATEEAILIVVLVSFLSAFGAAAGTGHFTRTFLLTLLSGLLINWVTWTLLTLLIVTRFYQAEARLLGMARVLGYANLPRILGVISIFGCAGSLYPLIGTLLSLGVAFVALRELLELTSEQTAITVGVAGGIMLVIHALSVWVI